MKCRVAINGFGRIGRLAFRQMHDGDWCDIVAINDLTSPKMLAHLLKYDSAHGMFNENISYTDKSIIAGGKEIAIYAEKNPADLPWRQLNIDVVLECTGFFASKNGAGQHLQAGAKKVIISAPAGNDVPTVVYGVNEGILKPGDTIVSAASCTTNCLAPMAKNLNDLAGIQKGYMTTVHAYTNDQSTLDGPHPKGDLRRARAAAHNIVPNSTGAAKAIGLVIPELEGKLQGSAQRVPVITGSITELTAVVEGHVTKEMINEKMKASVNDSFGYTEDEIVSSDVIGMRYGSLFDATQTMASSFGAYSMVKVAAWYDNENSYVSQLVRTLKYVGLTL